MSRYSSLDNDAQFQYLKPALPLKDQPKVSALATMELCWERLNKVYGNTQLNLVTIKRNLESFIPKGTQKFEKVIQLYEEVEKAFDQLKVINAVNIIAEDFQLIAALISKLPYEYQSDWDKEVIKAGQYVAMHPKTQWQKFHKFLSEVYEQANQAKLRNMSLASSLIQSTTPCTICNKLHKPPCRAPPKSKDDVSPYKLVKAHMTLAKITNKQELQDYIADRKKSYGPCPACNKSHTFEKEFPAPIGKAYLPSMRLDSCPEYMKKSPKERGELLEKVKGCYVCLDYKHKGEDFRIKNKTCDVTVGTGKCGGPHNKLLHNSGVVYCHATVSDAIVGAQKVLFDIQQLDLPGVTTSSNVVFDNTSSACLVTHEFAEIAGYEGTPVQYILQATGHPLMPKSTLSYLITLRDMHGNDHEVKALGIDKIS